MEDFDIFNGHFFIFYSHMVHFMAIWYTYLLVIWYIFYVLVCSGKKNLATLAERTKFHPK
jgi:hypothetical protein